MTAPAWLAIHFDRAAMRFYHTVYITEPKTMTFHIMNVARGHAKELFENLLMKLLWDANPLVGNN